MQSKTFVLVFCVEVGGGVVSNYQYIRLDCLMNPKAITYVSHNLDERLMGLAQGLIECSSIAGGSAEHRMAIITAAHHISSS